MTEDRGLIDPEGRYPSEGLRGIEARALEVLRHLPAARVERTRDVIQIEDGGEAGIVVLVTREALELRLPTIEWTMGAYGPSESSRLWKRVEWDELDEGARVRLIEQLREARQREFRPCPYCGGSFPPEHVIQENICHGCAERHLGVVF